MTAMATNMMAETSRSRRYPLLEPRAIRAAKEVVSKALATTMLPRIQTAGVTRAVWLCSNTLTPIQQEPLLPALALTSELFPGQSR